MRGKIAKKKKLFVIRPDFSRFFRPNSGKKKAAFGRTKSR
jgi:hypothetical protein